MNSEITYLFWPKHRGLLRENIPYCFPAMAHQSPPFYILPASQPPSKRQKGAKNSVGALAHSLPPATGGMSNATLIFKVQASSWERQGP